MEVQAVQDIHRPPSLEEQEQARRRLAFEELLLLQLTLLLRRHIMRCAGRAAAYAKPGCMKLASLGVLTGTLNLNSRQHPLQEPSDREADLKALF